MPCAVTSELCTCVWDCIFVQLLIMMPMMISWRFRGLMFIFLAVGHSSGENLYVCQKKTGEEYSYVKLNFSTSTLLGIEGSCSCKISLSGTLIPFIKIKTDELLFQNCTNGDIAFHVIAKKTITLACDGNNGIYATAEGDLSKVEQNSRDEVWLVMSRTGDSPLLSGSILISSATTGGSLGANYLMSCDEPNVNIPSIPTTQETSTYSSSTTSTTSTATNASTTSTTFTADSSTITSTTSTPPATTSTLATITTTYIPETSTFASSSEIHENSSRSTSSMIMSTSEDKSATGSESLKGNQATAIAGGAVGGLAVLAVIIIVVGLICYRKKKSSSSKENDTVPRFDDPYQMHAVHDNNHNNDSSDNQYKPDESNPLKSVKNDPEGVSTENTLYESSNRDQSSGPGRPNQPNSTNSESDRQNASVVKAFNAGTPDVEENRPKKTPDFTLEHEISASGDVYAIVSKTSKRD